MNRDDVLVVLRRLAAELLDLEPEQIQEGLSFRDDLDVDSLGVVEYTMAIEDELAIKLPEAEVIELKNITEFIDLIESKLAARV